MVLGRSLGCLAAAALLARRDYRVLLLGQGEPPPSYRFERFELLRRSPCVLFAASPVWRRILQDLAQSQVARRRTRRLSPSFSLLSNKTRLSACADRVTFTAELRRQYPDVQPVIDELWFRMGQASQALERQLASESTWPPSGPFARLKRRQLQRELPLLGMDAATLLEKFPTGHEYCPLAFLPAAFASHWAGAPERLPALAAARLQTQWLRNAAAFEGGRAGLEGFLLERIEAHGGICELSERAERLLMRRGRIVGVMAAGGDRTFGADRIVTGLCGRDLLELADVDSGAESRDWPDLRPAAGRFVVCCRVRREALPRPMAQEAFFLSEDGELALQGQSLPVPGQASECWLTAEVLVPLVERRRLAELRARVLAALCARLPFFERHLLICDSPHDGRPLQRFDSGAEVLVDRAHLSGSSRSPEPMRVQWQAEPRGFLDIAGEPALEPLRAAYLVGPAVYPGLGEEGELLAAWNVADAISRRAGTWQKRKQQMWTKIDTDSG